jgi:hypothetical protein
MNPVIFAPSSFVPVVIGFFGLATGYLVYGLHELFGSSSSSPETNKSVALWGLWMSGFMQFITGIFILVGLTWFQVFTSAPILYMAGLAFSAYGIHWFALAHQKYKGLDSRPNGGMAIAFFLLSVLGIIAFAGAGDIPVAIIFIGLALVYLTEIPTAFGVFPAGARLIGVWRILTAIWLLYMVYGVVLNTALGAKWWV